MSISLFRAIAHQYNDLRRVSSVAMMNTISHLIEEQVIAHQLPVELYAGFQRFSNLPSQRRRYERLGAVCRRVYVFGVPDVRPPSIPGVEYVEISPSHSLAREWFLVVDSPQFWTALLTQEADSGRDSGGGRRYDGIWTYDSQVAERTSLLLTQELGRFFEPVRQRDLEQQATHIAEISARLVGQLERTRTIGQRRWVQLCTLQKMAEALAKNRRTATLAWDAVQILRIIFGADDAAIALRTGDEKFLVAYGQGDGPEERTLALTQGPSGEALRTSQSVNLADSRRSRALDPLLPGAQSVIAAPIAGRRRTYGVITVGGERPGQWTDEDAQTIAAVGALLAGALDQRGDALEDVATRLERARGAEQVVARMQGAAGYVSELRRELDLVGGSGLTPTQRLAIERAGTLVQTLSRDLGLADERAVGAAAE